MDKKISGRAGKHARHRMQPDPAAGFLDMLARLVAQHHVRLSREAAPAEQKPRRRRGGRSKSEASPEKIPRRRKRL
jgi:hypothetical protein